MYRMPLDDYNSNFDTKFNTCSSTRNCNQPKSIFLLKEHREQFLAEIARLRINLISFVFQWELNQKDQIKRMINQSIKTKRLREIVMKIKIMNFNQKTYLKDQLRKNFSVNNQKINQLMPIK